MSASWVLRGAYELKTCQKYRKQGIGVSGGKTVIVILGEEAKQPISNFMV
jgi:hypothetical protein